MYVDLVTVRKAVPIGIRIVGIRAGEELLQIRVPVEIGGVRIHPGDIVVGDVDGVCVVPKAAEFDTFMGAIEKARGEKTVKKAIENGMSAREAFERFGIL